MTRQAVTQDTLRSVNMAAAEGGPRKKKTEPAIRFYTSFHNTVFDVMRRRGWKEVDMDGYEGKPCTRYASTSHSLRLQVLGRCVG